VRIGLLGVGRIGRRHAETLASIDGIEELLVGDVDEAAASEVAAKVRGRAAAIDEVVAASDAIVIAAATDAHARLVHAGLERGIAVFCEKPLAGSLHEAIALAREVEASGIRFQLGFQRRFDAGYREARRLLETGELGTLYCVRMAGHDPAPPPESYIPVSGGLFHDFSVHDFDILRWLTGSEVVEAYADGSVRGFPVFEKYDDIDTGVIILRLDSGALVAMTVGRHDPRGYDVRTELFGSRDSVSVGLGPRQVIRSVEPGVPTPEGPAWPSFQDRFADAYRDEIIGFVEVARGLAVSPCTARDGVEASRIAEAATRSRREHRPVRLEEIPGEGGAAPSN
jgi:myo-inositol 2-dehydrogenase / D-chiro-inositol 1-dehydrogenase